MSDSTLSITRASSSSSMPEEPLLALAPLSLPNRRNTRYIGDDSYIGLDQLADRDQTLLKNLYQILGELLSALVDTATDNAAKWQEVIRWTEHHDLNGLIDEVREMGVASHARGSTEALAKAMHDLRGGALSALLGRLQLVTRLPRTERELQTIFVLTRDHLKIMRNAVVGLDEPRREADRIPKAHAARLIVEKWHGSVVGPNWGERPIRFLVDCRYDGALTECCLESAAIDRIFYNLANNACRHASGDRLEMAIFPLPSGECLRFVLSNQVNEEDARLLRGLQPEGADSVDRGTGQSFFVLFEPTVSSTGSGFGLTVVADFVASAFGLKNRQEALRNRYVGAVLDGSTFRVWFHWPIADGTLPPKLDDLHYPHQSLSEP